jgi:hypothetical protein
MAYFNQMGYIITPAAVTGVSYDPLEERLWTGRADGYLTSYTVPHLQTYSSTKVLSHGDADSAEWSVVKQVPNISPIVSASGVVVPSKVSLKFFDRGGFLNSTISAQELSSYVSTSGPKTDASTLQPPFVYSASPMDGYDSFGNAITQRLLVGGSFGHLLLLDSSRVWSSSSAGTGAASLGGGNAQRRIHRALSSFQLSHDAHVIVPSSEGSRALAVASKDSGKVTFFDPALRSPSPIGSWAPHSGGISSIDINRAYVLTSGFLSPAGTPAGAPASKQMYDPFLKLFDLRMMRAAAPLSVPGNPNAVRAAGPMYVKFVPDAAKAYFDPAASTPGVTSSVALVGTASGRLFSVDPARDAVFSLFYSLDTDSTATERGLVRAASSTSAAFNTSFVNVTSVALAPSGASISVGDSDGFLYSLSANPTAATSLLGRISEPAVDFHTVQPWISADARGNEHKVWQEATVLGARVYGTGKAEPVDSAATPYPHDAAEKSVDATFVLGTGHNVPVDAPGLCTANSLVSTVTSSLGGQWEPFSAVWSCGGASELLTPLPRTSMPPFGTQGLSEDEFLRLSSTMADIHGERVWAKTQSVESSGQKPGRGFRKDLFSTYSLAPARSRPSTWPESFSSSLVSLPRLRSSVDPVLMSYCDSKNSSYINNRHADLKLTPNSLVFGKRKGYVDIDARHRGAGKSALGIVGKDGEDLHAAALAAAGGR